MTQPMPKVPQGGVLLNHLLPTLKLTFKPGSVDAEFGNFPIPMVIGACHLLQNGAAVIVIEPKIVAAVDVPMPSKLTG